MKYILYRTRVLETCIMLLYYYVCMYLREMNDGSREEKKTHTHHHGAKVGVFPFGIRRRFMARLMFYYIICVCLLYILYIIR